MKHEPVGQAVLAEPEFQAIAAIMMSEARIGLSPAKRGMIQSRLARRLRTCELDNFPAYVQLVGEDAGERQAMVTALTTNHTSFFRESHHFDHVRDVLLPQLMAAAGRGERLRLWSAGCSTGEEVYSLAMCLLGPDRQSADWLRGRDLRLLATDIAEPVVAAVQAAEYQPDAANGVPEPYRSSWLQEGGGLATIAPEARQLVTARVLNLFAEWPMRQRYQAIFCRNVMIYFDDAAKTELQLRLVEQLAPGGFLYLGHSERLLGPAADALQPCGQTIYVKPAEAP